MDYMVLIEDTRDTLLEWTKRSDLAGNVEVYVDYLRDLAENLTAALEELRS